MTTLSPDIVYLDNAATTPCYPEVVDTVTELFLGNYGCTSSDHALGKEALHILETSRKSIARTIGAKSSEIVFTSGATESNSLAIFGAATFARTQGRTHIVACALEHPSVLKPISVLEAEGFEVTYIDAVHGNLDLAALRASLRPDTAIISVCRVQDQFGYVFPIEEVVRIRDEYAPQAIVHCDAVQSYGKIATKLHTPHADLISLSAHKIGGPEGIGLLYVRKGTGLFSIIMGEGQERGFRSGTEPIALIGGFAKAIEINRAQKSGEYLRVEALRNNLEDQLREISPHVVVNSRRDGSPYILNFSILGIDNAAAVAFLSERGIYVGRATGRPTNRRNVITIPTQRRESAYELAGIPKSRVRNTLRVSFSHFSTQEHVDALVKALAEFLAQQN